MSLRLDDCYGHMDRSLCRHSTQASGPNPTLGNVQLFFDVQLISELHVWDDAVAVVGTYSLFIPDQEKEYGSAGLGRQLSSVYKASKSPV